MFPRVVHLIIAVAFAIAACSSAKAELFTTIDFLTPQPEIITSDDVTQVLLPGAESAIRVGKPDLPVTYRQLAVRGGRFDSVTVSREGSRILASSPRVRLALDETTFAGDDLRPADHYSRLLAERAVLDDQHDDSNPLEDITVVDGTMILTVAIRPVSYDQGTDQLIAYDRVRISFWGSEDLTLTEAEEMNRVLLSINPRVAMQPHKPHRSVLAAESTLEYVVVTSSSFANQFDRLVWWKQTKGLTAGIVPIELIVSLYPGVDDAERLRNFLIESYYERGTRFALLAGDETVLPVRYAYHGNTSVTPPLDMLQICDLYFGDVDGDWDVDGDGIYGEPSHDRPDLYPEILVGRLPFGSAEQFAAFVDKLIAYEQNPGWGDHNYLNQALFISADQMRDYQEAGQHQLIAAALPTHIVSDLVSLVEAPSGIAGNPPEPTAQDAIATMSAGWGLTSLLIHGISDGWVVRSHQYNEWPKSYLFTANGTDGSHGFLPNLSESGKPGLVYSIGCDNGAFDADSPPFPSTNPCVAEMLLAKPAGGAVAFVGYSRWGWVSTSWKLEKAFVEDLYGGSGRPADALRNSKMQFPYYRDLAYGLNYYGDPEMSYWRDTPEKMQLSVEVSFDQGAVTAEIEVTTNNESVSGAVVSITRNGLVTAQTRSDFTGSVTLESEFNPDDTFFVTVVAEGYKFESTLLSPDIALDAPDEEGNQEGHLLPYKFALEQNFPNPFNPATTITFSIPRSAEVVIAIYNIIGQRVRELLNDEIAAGQHQVQWDGTTQTGEPASSGIYFARLEWNNQVATIKMALLK